ATTTLIIDRDCVQAMTKPLRWGATARLAALSFGLAAVLAMAALPAGAHPAPDPANSDTRLLADQTDDCGSEAPPQNDCRHADDLIALDIREVYDHGDVTIFRLWAEHGSASNLEDRLTFSSGSGTKTLSWKTNDGRSYTGAGFDSVGSPQTYG